MTRRKGLKIYEHADGTWTVRNARFSEFFDGRGKTDAEIANEIYWRLVTSGNTPTPEAKEELERLVKENRRK